MVAMLRQTQPSRLLCMDLELQTPSRSSTRVHLRKKMVRRGAGVSSVMNLLFGAGCWAGCLWDDPYRYFLKT